ncbi:MAG TPA: hypothetical protein VLF68_05255 [Candidatus Saccharimonadales bacterium]|nr:hypothetical protein [Candidatus Saccharimonadales bacterium]
MRRVVLLLILFICLFVFKQEVFAVEDPLSLPNNKFGIHILFPNEIDAAAKLVNSNGGDWGYVTIPIQAGDKDLKKWQEFMDKARILHVIPIIRLATEGDYFNTKVWRKPDFSDVLDFANFLNSLNWPTKNRYVVVFNEVNRGDEWGGTPDADEYAQILGYAVSVFKSKTQNFFIISAGLDNASTNSSSSINEYSFLQQMNVSVPGIFNQIDGLGSHAYPNPGFSQPPSVMNSESIQSFFFEENLADGLSNKDLPVFITETGWSQERVGEENAAFYLVTAFQNNWSDSRVVAVTPFLFSAQAGPFEQFSFLDKDQKPNGIYKSFQNIAKTKGTPGIEPAVLGNNVYAATPKKVEDFAHTKDQSSGSVWSLKPLAPVVKWLLQVDKIW